MILIIYITYFIRIHGLNGINKREKPDELFGKKWIKYEKR